MKLYVLDSFGWDDRVTEYGYPTMIYWYSRNLNHGCLFAIVRERDGIVIACSRLTSAQTNALYAVIGRVETEAA